MDLFIAAPELNAYACTLVAPLGKVNICYQIPLPLPDLYLYLATEGLVLHSKAFKPLNLRQFYREFIDQRRRTCQREILLQALNLKAKNFSEVSALDVTAGLGRDSILMSLAGLNVTMLENNPYLGLILNYLCHEFKVELPNLQFIYAENQTYLNSIQTKFNVIYLDPMFADNKTALAKKDMQLIELCLAQAQNMLQLNYTALFSMCRQHCSNKILVKRDNKQAPLVLKPVATYVKFGKTIRFDVYQC